MVLLILGATGLLGQYLINAAFTRSYEAVASSCSGGDYAVDMSHIDELFKLLNHVQPDVIINSAAITDLRLCEENVDYAWAVNSGCVRALASWATANEAKLVQISTDHYFVGDGDRPHNELEPVVLVNEYAKSKYAAEMAALQMNDSLVIRTAFVGHALAGERQTFLDWVTSSLHTQANITLFDDAFFSPITCVDLAETIFDLIECQHRGLLNVGGSAVISKGDFIREVASIGGTPLVNATAGSVSELFPARANSLGLDVRLVEKVLGRRMPDIHHRIPSLLA